MMRFAPAFRLATVSAAALCVFGLAAQAQQNEISLYTGFQSAPHSSVDFTDETSAVFDFGAGWEGRPFEMPPYYGWRYTRWVNDDYGWGVEFNHAKVYADDETLTDSGFSDLEFTDGLNIITLNGWRRWQTEGSRWTPYVGGGIGISVPHVDVTTPLGGRTFEYQLTGPAIMLAAGVSYEINDRWSVFGEYKGTYSMNEADLAGGATLETDIITNALNVGLTFSF